MAENDLIPTGIRGLDTVFLGGVRRGNVILVQGAAGTGKTLLGIEFVYRGITQFNEPGLIVTFEVTPQRIVRDAASFGWDLDALQQQNRLKIIFSSPQVLSQELRAPNSVLLETAAGMGAQRIFIDGVGLLRMVTNDLNATNTPNSNEMVCYRELLQQLIQGLHRENLTAMLSHEVTAFERQAFCLEVTEYLVDTVIQLKREPKRRGIQRSLEITKSRGQDYDTGRHTLRITSGKGLEVYRRVQAPPRNPRAYDQPTSTTMRSLIGPGPLDELMGGGVYDGSVTMVVGVSGTGKSILGVQTLLEAARQGQPGLLVSLDEHPKQILRNAATLGLNLQEHVDSGLVQVIYDCPQELDLDVHFDRIARTVEEHKVRRMVVDGMSSYSATLSDQALYREFVHGLVTYSKTHLMTTFLSYENPELFGVTQFMPDFPVSSLVDNIILLNYVELSDTARRGLTVTKARASAHRFVTREYTVGPGGITVLPVDEGLRLPVLPFARYYNLLSRAPTRLSPDVLPGDGKAVLAPKEE